jgi:hypothetical protein
MVGRSVPFFQSLFFFVTVVVSISTHIGYASALTFWHLSDIHLDPLFLANGSSFSNCRVADPSAKVTPFGKYGCDAPQRLLESALDYMNRVQPNPDFIIISGDFSAHDYQDESSILSAISAATSLIQSKLNSNIPVFPAMGNDDCSADYKFSLVNHTWTHELAHLWAQWLPSSALDTFTYAGYYSVPVTPQLTVVILNTVLYSPRLSQLHDMDVDIGGQVAFVEQQLIQARNQGGKVLLVGHIPPGGAPYDDTDIWVEPYVQIFQDLATAYEDVLLAFAAGHLHSDDFRFLENTLVLLAPSISLINHNNPGVRLFTLDDKSSAIREIETHYADICLGNPANALAWGFEYSHREFYGIESPIDGYAMKDVFRAIMQDGRSFSAYNAVRTVQYDVNRYRYLCSIADADLGAWHDCLAAADDSYCPLSL